MNSNEKYQKILNALAQEKGMVARREIKLALFSENPDPTLAKINAILNDGYPDDEYSTKFPEQSLDLVDVHGKQILLELALRHNQIYICFIQTSRGKGEGTDLIQFLTKQSDELGINLLLETHNERVGNGNSLRLANFYMKNGFETDYARFGDEYEEYDKLPLDLEACQEGVPMIYRSKAK